MSYPPPSPPPSPEYGAPVPQPAFAPPPPKKSNTGTIVGVIVGIVLLICLGCGGAFAYFTWWAKGAVEDVVNNLPTDFPTDFPTNAPGNKTGPHKVRYEVTGSGQALITYARGTGGQDSETVQLPWSKEITVDRASFGVQVFAFPKGGEAALEACTISVDDTVRKTGKFANNTLICSYTYVGN